MSENIKKLRKKLHLTQEQLAEICGVNRVTVSCWENGKYEPDRKSLEKLSVALNVSVDTLMSPQEQKSAPAGQIVNGGDNNGIQLVNSGDINAPITQNVSSERTSNQSLGFSDSMFYHLPLFRYFDITKYGKENTIPFDEEHQQKYLFRDYDPDNPPFAILRDERELFRLNKYNYQNVTKVILTPVSKIDIDGKIYLVTYNSRSSLQRVMKIPPDAGYILENDDGKIEVRPEYVKTGGFKVHGRVVYTLENR